MKNNKITIYKKELKFCVYSIILFLGIETIARMFNWYESYPYYDVLSHFLFGVGFFSLIWLFDNKNKLNFFDYSKIYLIVALSWEFLEHIGDSIFSSPQYLKDIFFFDGVTDVIFGFIGLYVANEILKKYK